MADWAVRNNFTIQVFQCDPFHEVFKLIHKSETGLLNNDVAILYLNLQIVLCLEPNLHRNILRDSNWQTVTSRPYRRFHAAVLQCRCDADTVPAASSH